MNVGHSEAQMKLLFISKRGRTCCNYCKRWQDNRNIRQHRVACRRERLKKAVRKRRQTGS